MQLPPKNVKKFITNDSLPRWAPYAQKRIVVKHLLSAIDLILEFVFFKTFSWGPNFRTPVPPIIQTNIQEYLFKWVAILILDLIKVCPTDSRVVFLTQVSPLPKIFHFFSSNIFPYIHSTFIYIYLQSVPLILWWFSFSQVALLPRTARKSRKRVCLQDPCTIYILYLYLFIFIFIYLYLYQDRPENPGNVFACKIPAPTYFLLVYSFIVSL